MCYTRRKWKYDEGDRSTGVCMDCGKYYGGAGWVDAVVPDAYWELINPTNDKGCGLLCFNCMAMRFEFLGLQEVPIYFGSGPFSHGHDVDKEWMSQLPPDFLI